LARELFDERASGGFAGALKPRFAVLSLSGAMSWICEWHRARTPAVSLCQWGCQRRPDLLCRKVRSPLQVV